MSRALHSRGFDVTVAHTVQDALHAIETEPPEFAVVDLKLPDESGLRLVSQAQGGRSAHADRRADRSRQHPDRDRGDQARRDLLPREADRCRHGGGELRARRRRRHAAGREPADVGRARSNGSTSSACSTTTTATSPRRRARCRCIGARCSASSTSGPRRPEPRRRRAAAARRFRIHRRGPGMPGT